MKIHRQFLRQAWAIFGPLKWRMLAAVSVIALVQALSLVGPYIQGAILDNLSRGKEMGETYRLIAIAAAVWVGTAWLIQFPREMYEVNKIDFDINERADDHTMAHLTNLSVGQHNSLHSGVKQSIINRGQNGLTALVNTLIYEILPTTTRATIMIGAMCWLSIAMGLIVLVAVSLFLALTFWVNHIFSKDLKNLEKMWNKESKFRGEILQNIGHILVNAQEKKARAEADAKYGEAVRIAKPLWRKFLFFAYLKGMTLTLGRVAVMVLGVHYVYSGQYTFGSIVVFWAWSGNAFDSIGNVGSLQRQIMRMWTSIKRYCEFLDIENDVTVIANPVVLQPLHGRIEVRNLSFRYDSRMHQWDEDEEGEKKTRKPEKSRQLALENVSFVIEPGETVAIVGESGSGKTTLANMLVRSNDPSTGQILIDGQDLRVIELKGFRQKVGVVEQHVPLFDRSMRDNILYGLNGKAKDVTEEELERIAQISQIKRFSHKLENGYDTLIGERGIKLSGGERQRVGIARALIKDPAILIFDEATSSLDAAVEAEIREAIKEASKGRTTILIAHRFSTIRYANRIIVMEEGRVAGEGSHESLYRTCPPYRRLVDHQVTTVQ